MLLRYPIKLEGHFVFAPKGKTLSGQYFEDPGWYKGNEPKISWMNVRWSHLGYCEDMIPPENFEMLQSSDGRFGICSSWDKCEHITENNVLTR